MDETSIEQNLTLSQRALPNPGTGDWGDFYTDVRDRTETTLVDNEVEWIPERATAVHFQAWGVTPMNVMIEQLKGCAALFCVSHHGVAVAHFWENPSILHAMEDQVLYPLQEMLGDPNGLYTFGDDPICHLMAGTAKAIGGNGPEEQETLTRSDPDGYRHEDKIDQIVKKITDILPRATVKTFAYARQVSRGMLAEDDDGKVKGYGRGAVRIISLFSASRRT